jgi:hypothetical protein
MSLEVEPAAISSLFFVRALEIALVSDDWDEMESCRGQLLTIYRELGESLWLGQPLLDGELPSIFPYATEGRHGSSPSVTAVRMAAEDVLIDPATVQEEILSYFGGILNGFHKTAADR